MKRILISLFICSYSLVYTQSNLIMNGDFETGDFSYWTVETFGVNTFEINDGTYEGACWDDIFGIAPPISGNFSAINDQDMPGLGLISSGFIVPDEVQDVWLVFDVQYFNDGDPDFDPVEQDFKVFLLNDQMETTELLYSFFDENVSPSQLIPRRISINITNVLSPYSGEMMYLQFLNIVTQDCFPLQIDNIGIIENHNIPTLSQWGLILLSFILVISGVIAVRQKSFILNY